MFELNGKYGKAKIFTNNMEGMAQSQVIEVLNQSFIQNSKIRIMPDTHAGAGCVIGTTMTIKDKVVPNLVGVDIGCGMETIKIKEKEIDPVKLDKIINEVIPAGFETRTKEHLYTKFINLNRLRSKGKLNINRANLSIGTLGGGNHFIEANIDDQDNIYIVIHSGSRNLGKQVAEYYQDKAYQEITSMNDKRHEIIAELKAQGKEKEISSALKKLQKPKIKKDLAYLEGQGFEDYIHDMRITQQFAIYNRKAMVDEIIKAMDLTIEEQFTTIHNYIDLEHMILRKGAISAQKKERVLIPINMRDGSIIATGLGNSDWNYSAPHGAGRLMSRSKAKEVINLEDFKKSMEGIYTTSVNSSTIDESPFAYKSMSEILEKITGTVKINKIIKPIYNFKASSINQSEPYWKKR